MGCSVRNNRLYGNGLIFGSAPDCGVKEVNAQAQLMAPFILSIAVDLVDAGQKDTDEIKTGTSAGSAALVGVGDYCAA